MTYEQTIELIKRTASAHPKVATFYYGSVLELNEHRNWKYPVVILSPRITTSPNGMYQFSFVMWYVDKMARDRRDYIAIQSTAITTLTDIGLKIDEGEHLSITKATTSVFDNRFNDICAGAMCDMDILTPAEVCADFEIE